MSKIIYHTNHHIKEPMAITTTANTVYDKILLDLVGPLDRDNNNHNTMRTNEVRRSLPCDY